MSDKFPYIVNCNLLPLRRICYSLQFLSVLQECVKNDNFIRYMQMISQALQILGIRRKHVSARHHIRVARIGYFLAGFSIACWAPLIPYVKEILNLSAGDVTKLVFCMGLGSICGMLISGFLTQKLGSKITYTLSSLGTTFTLVILSFIPAFNTVLVVLLCFGISVGCLEVGINIYAAYLERKYRLRLMSPFHAYYSLGEVLGSGLIIILLTLNLPPHFAIPSLIVILYVTAAYYIPCVMDIKTTKITLDGTTKKFILPCYPVTHLAIITALIFIVGGAMVDWSGLYAATEGNVDLKYAAFGYTLVSLCMLLCRIYGSKIIFSFGPFKTAFYGAILCTTGLFTIVLFPNPVMMIIGFCCIGIGMSNITPLSLSTAARQNKMPIVSAVSFISVSGYAALLLGPALLGAIAQIFTLKGTFIFLGSITVIACFIIFSIRHEYEP